MQRPIVTARLHGLALSLVISLPTMQMVRADADMADSLDFEAFHQTKKNVPKPHQKEKNSREGVQLSIPKHYVHAAYTTEVGAFARVLAGLIVDMDKQCPAGWEKLREWSSRESNSRYLNFEFRCL